MFVFSKVFVPRDHPPTESSLIACALLAAGDVTPPPPAPPIWTAESLIQSFICLTSLDYFGTSGSSGFPFTLYHPTEIIMTKISQKLQFRPEGKSECWCLTIKLPVFQVVDRSTRSRCPPAGSPQGRSCLQMLRPAPWRLFNYWLWQEW